MIYTSYFANLKNIPESIFRVSIARYSDKFPDIPKYEKLMPSPKLMHLFKKGIYNEFRFIRAFNSQIYSLDAEIVVDELNTLSRGRDVVLLCYEAPDKFCHRQLVSKWLVDNCIRAQEFGERELTKDEWIRKFGATDEDLGRQFCPNCD